MRYNANGKLDSTFGEAGLAVFDFDTRPAGSGKETAAALKIQGSGASYSIIAAGEVSQRFALVRLKSDGSLDTSFGPRESPGLVLGPPGSAASLTLQRGKWILAGRTSAFGEQGFDFKVARFDAGNGAWDRAFGDNGEAVIDINPNDASIDGAEGVVADATGIYSMGYGGTGPDERTMAVVRLVSDGPDGDQDGSLDANYGDGGKFTRPAGSLSSAVLHGGNLVAAGRDGDRMALIRLTPAGTLDATFGTGGVAVGPVGRAAALALHGSAFVAAGRNTPDEDMSSWPPSIQQHRDALIARFGPDGRLDPSFGSAGSVVTDFGEAADDALAVDFDGAGAANPKIVVAGRSGLNSSFKFALARYVSSSATENVDLVLSMTAKPAVRVGDALVYDISIENRASQHAFGVRVEQSLPNQSEFAGAHPSQGTCSPAQTNVRCQLGGILAGESKNIRVTVAPVASGTMSSSATLTTTSTDNASGNSASVRTTVTPGEGVFSPAARMNEGRRFQVATLLAGDPCSGVSQPEWCGKVLVVGGKGVTSELYHPQTNVWTPVLDPMKVSPGFFEWGMTATSLRDGRVLVMGSSDDSRAQLYDPREGVTGAWTAIEGPTGTPRFGHVAVQLADGRVLVAGEFSNQQEVDCGPDEGRKPGAHDSSAHIFDVSQQEGERWTPTGSMRTGRSSTDAGKATATLLPDGDVLVVGGDKGALWADAGPAGGDPDACDGTGPLAPGEIYDQESETWRDTGGPEIPRHGHTATLLQNNKVLIAGGNTTVGDKITTANAVIYDPKDTSSGRQGSWKNTDSLMIFGRTGHAAARLPNGKVLLTGGVSIPRKGSEYAPKTAELYDPMNGTFQSAGITSWRTNHTAVTLGSGSRSACGGNCGKVLLAGGDAVPDFLGRSPTDILTDPTGASPTAAVNTADLYTSPPSIARLDPPEGPIAGNTEIVISGVALASTSKVTFEGQGPLQCGDKGIAKCWVDDEAPDLKIYALTPPQTVPRQVQVVVETLPGLIGSGLFRYLGEDLPKGITDGERLEDVGGLGGNQQNSPPVAPPPGTTSIAQTANATANGVSAVSPPTLPPGNTPPVSVLPQSPQPVPQAVQGIQISLQVS